MLRNIGMLPAIVMSITLAIVFIGVAVYVLSQIATNLGQNNPVSQLVTSLGTWGTTWFPIILVVAGAAIIISMLLRGFTLGGR